MKKQTNALKISLLGAAVALFSVGCASTGHARYDADRDTNHSYAATEDDRAAAESTVSALGRTVETRADWANKFPFYDYKLRTMETYTFAVPDPSVDVAVADVNAPQFSADLPPGSVYVEAAGGAGEVRTGRVIRHSANPIR